MKKFMVLGMISLSATAFGQNCRIDMVTKDNDIVRSFTVKSDNPENCLEGKKMCQKAISDNYLYHPQLNDAGLNCRHSGEARENYTAKIATELPNMFRDNSPVKASVTGNIKKGTKVIYNNNYYGVIDFDSKNDTYTLQNTWLSKTIESNIKREKISVTKGCFLDICADEMVLDTKTNKITQAVGISITGTYSTSSVHSGKGIISQVHRTQLAKLYGCVQTGTDLICVGDVVKNSKNAFMHVKAIQSNGQLAIANYNSSEIISGVSLNQVKVHAVK